jgi:aldose sugar dehydrogenase
MRSGAVVRKPGAVITRRVWGGAAVAAGLAAVTPACAQTTSFDSGDHPYEVVTVVDGLEHPWSLAFLPGGDMLVTERPGRLRVIRDGALVPQPIGGVPEVWVQGQGGLLEVLPHPDFERNRLVYLSFSKPGADGATTAVVRGRFDGERLNDVEEIFEASAWTDRRVHFGSRLVFDDDGFLFITIGDRGVMEEAQNTSNHQGTILRLHDDGRIPEDNPFVGQAGVQPEIWAYGIRSPQGLALHPETRALWETEHGPRGGDEINLIQPGRNYGWPVITYGINYNGEPISDITEKPGMEQPLHHWTPSIATSGLAFYTGHRFPAWRGNLFTGALAGQHVARVVLDGTRVVREEKLLDGFGERFRDVRDGPDGYLYLLTDSPQGRVLRLEPSS